MAATNVGENVQYEVKGDKLVITIDLSHRGENSDSGKSVRIASTLGNTQLVGVDSKIRIGLNAYQLTK